MPEERVSSVLEFIESKGMVCSVYGAQYLLEGLYDAGVEDRSLALMIDTDTDRSWPHMIYNVGTTITTEAWDLKYKRNEDWSHSWGVGPCNIIPRKLMGIEPLEAGFRRVRIRPLPGNLDYATIKLPTVRGTITVSYAKEAGKTFLDITIPANVIAEVIPPFRVAKDFEVKSTELKPLIKELRDGVFEVLPGKHRFQSA